MPEADLLQFRTVYDSPMIAVRDYICTHDHREASPEEESDSNSITLMRHGAFARHFGRQKVTSDVNQASFFSRGAVYRVSHPTGCGDRGTSMVVAPSILSRTSSGSLIRASTSGRMIRSRSHPGR